LTKLSSTSKMDVLESCQQTRMTYTSAERTVEKLLMMGRGTSPKHVEFFDKNKFGKISASVGFIKKKSKEQVRAFGRFSVMNWLNW
jgi:hypothetical protein